MKKTPTKEKPITVYASPELRRELEKLAASQHRDLSAQCVVILSNAVAAKEDQCLRS